MGSKYCFRITSASEQCPRIQRWFETLSVYRYTLEFHTVTPNINPNFLSRLPQLGTSIDTDEAGRLSHSNDIDVYFIGAAGM